MIYDIWDDVERRTCKAKVEKEDLSKLNITEFNGRFRYTEYGDDKSYPFPLDAKQLEMWMRNEYTFETGYYEFHLKHGDEIIFNMNEDRLEDDIDTMCKNASQKGENMFPHLLGLIDSMLYYAKLAAEEDAEFDGVLYDADKVEHNLAVWVIARGIFTHYFA